MPKKSKRPTVSQNKPSTTMLSNDSAASGWRDRIQTEMQKAGLSQRRLSQLSGLGPTSIRFALKEADSITTETLRRVANALNVPYEYLASGVRAVVEGPPGDEEFRRIKLLVVEDPSAPHHNGHDVVPVHASHMPEHLEALRISNTAMRPDGANARVPEETVLVPGDVVIYSRDVRATVGSLAVVDLHQGHKEVRMLVQGDDGHLQAVASNHAFGRSRVTASQLLGKVLLVHRALRH